MKESKKTLEQIMSEQYDLLCRSITRYSKDNLLEKMDFIHPDNNDLNMMNPYSLKVFADIFCQRFCELTLCKSDVTYFLKNKEILKAFLHKFKMYNFDEFVEKGQFKVTSEYCIYNKEYNKECRFDIIIFFGSDKNVDAYNSSVIIEAKVYSKENIYKINQTEITQKELYQKTIAENPNLFGKCTCLYLTLENEDDMTNNFENIIWLDILAALQKYILYLKPDDRKSAYLIFLQLWIGGFLCGVYKCPKAQDFENKRALKNKDKLISFIKQLADNGEK